MTTNNFFCLFLASFKRWFSYEEELTAMVKSIYSMEPIIDDRQTEREANKESKECGRVIESPPRRTLIYIQFALRDLKKKKNNNSKSLPSTLNRK